MTFMFLAGSAKLSPRLTFMMNGYRNLIRQVMTFCIFVQIKNTCVYINNKAMMIKLLPDKKKMEEVPPQRMAAKFGH